MEKLLYARYSNQRAARFSVNTEIRMRPDGTRIVRKYADTPKAGPHIQGIKKAFGQLQELYRDLPLAVNRCMETADGLELEYLEGETWETALDEALLKERDETLFYEEMHRYLKMVLPEQRQKPFQMTGEYAGNYGYCYVPAFDMYGWVDVRFTY